MGKPKGIYLTLEALGLEKADEERRSRNLR